MNSPQHLRIEDYTYDLPQDKIAKYPLAQRDESKLLIYRDGQLSEDIYKNIAAHLPADSLLVFNQTKVIHARLLFQKPTGGKIEVFCLEPDEQYADVQTAMLQKGKVLWKCLVGGAAKWKPNTSILLHCAQPAFTLQAAMIEKTGDAFILELSWDNEALTFAEILNHAGKMPLPPYMNRQAEHSDDVRYQTVFAKAEGSVAAPTAGLHFTEQVLDSLREKGIDTAFLTLHVGAGTFKPVKSETMQEHEMHAEWIDVDRETIEHIISSLDKKIVAVGTTSMRTLESLYWIGCKLLQEERIDFAGIAITQWEPYTVQHAYTPEAALKAIVDWLIDNKQQRLITRTQILIAPGYEYKIVKGLVTNFHQPQSTLLLLVAALIGNDWRKVYNYALQHNYRFLSYGDGCLLWPTRA